MPSVDAESPDETFFNDLTQQVSDSNENRPSPSKADGLEGQKDDAANKLKRIACVLCRKRKLRCDGARPGCGTCKRLKHDCTYDDVRKKSGPKRGYVKLLEARLQHVETLLKTQESTDQNKDASQQDPTTAYVASTVQQGLSQPHDITPASFSEGISPLPEVLLANESANSHAADGEFSWEMIGLGLEEPLPPQDVMSDLYNIYFSKIHPSLPIIHRRRFLAAMNLAPQMRPPVCLRYIMWTMAASVTDKYEALQDHFYQRARKYAQMDEMKGHGERTISVAHCQTWILVTTYEFKQMYFPRAWLSTGRAVRLAQMMQLHRLDGAGLDVKQCLAPPKDWTEKEERRRTFWMAFCIDRYASIGTGWPMTIDEQDILTNLPSSEEAFEMSKAMASISLAESLKPNGGAKLQALGAVALTAALFGRNLLHLHRPGPNDRDDDINGGFWTRHREIESTILSTSLSLPDYLRLPNGLPDPKVAFINMALQTSAICLHQAAIFKADKFRLSATVSNESKARCITAAAEIASAMRMISHMDLTTMNPFVSFCVYVAARVFVQYLKNRPKDKQIYSSLQFLLQAMQALRRKNPLTESFLVQLDLDLEAAGLPGGYGLSDPTTGPNTDMENLSAHVGNVFDGNRIAAAAREPCMNLFSAASGGGANSLVPISSRQYASNPPGDAYYVSNPLPNLETPNVAYPPSQGSEQIQPPARGRPTNSQLHLAAAFTLHEEIEIEMDISPDDQPSPETINSRSIQGSTSHSSWSPAGQNQNDLLNTNSNYRSSPKNMAITNNNQMPLPQVTTPNSHTSFFPSGEDMFAAGLFNSGTPISGDAMSNGFLMGSDWELAGIGTGNVSMAPMSESSWNQMLDTMNAPDVGDAGMQISLGWDLGPSSHGMRPG